MDQCVFLDRDGVINHERGDYTFRIDDFHILDGVGKGLEKLKSHGYLNIIVTNQAGISKGLYTKEQMETCHGYLHQQHPGLIDAIYHCPYHPTITESLTRKPDTLMMEKAQARFKIDLSRSWMVGDRERDMEAAHKLGVRFIQILDKEPFQTATHHAESLEKAAEFIIKS